MKKYELSPIRERTSDYDKLEEKIRKLFLQVIYFPLLKQLDNPKAVILNSEDDLVRAIKSGRIRFYRGKFTGKFSSKISKELKSLGAEWDGSAMAWKVPLESLSSDLRMAVRTAEDAARRMASAIEKQLNDLLPTDVGAKFNATNFFDQTIWRTQREIEKSVKGITVAPQLTEEQAANIAKAYNTNLQKYIQDFTQKEILDLRNKISESTLSGARYESMVKVIEESYGVSSRKAKFLARQETGLMMAAFRRERYTGMGSQKYVWRCVVGSPKHPVRPMHKRLDGTEQLWSSPPITDDDGHRNHPGEDYNCRCTARPIIQVAD